MSHWLISDTHFGHKNIIKYCERKFDSLQEMDDCFIDNINKYVRVQDTLWHLGDFAFSRKKFEYYKVCQFYRNRIKCKNVILVFGNHDRRIIKDLFAKTYDIAELKFDNKFFVFCHYAMITYNKSHYGAYHFYGHTHGRLESTLDSAFPLRKSLDVGIDHVYNMTGEYRPIRIEEAVSLVEERYKKVFDCTNGRE